jgi:hypothetical protein
MNNSSYFIQEKTCREEHLREIRKYIPINKYLKDFDWFFIHPLYMQGFEINILENLMKEGNTDPEKIKEVFIRKFHTVDFSASFIRGFCIRSKYIAPFTQSIEHSMILAYQRDYEGAIKTLMPIIEGILRQYLILEKNFTNEKIFNNELKGSLDFIKEGILNNVKKWLENYISPLNNQSVIFDANQIEELFSLEKERFDIWFSFFNEFIKKSLYARSNGSEGLLNRHSILHELNDKTFIYSIENYIKLYSSLHFLLWALLILEGKGVLAEISNEDHMRTYKSYKQIIYSSKFLIEAKAELDDRYKPFIKPTTSMRETIIKTFLHISAFKKS